MSYAIDGSAIDKVLQDAVASGAVPHVAAIAADRDGVVYQGAAGPRAAGESDPVTVDTIFRIMSMTKMPCTVAALQRVEQGSLDLDAPVAEYCPDFAGIQVLAGFDGDTPVTRPPATQATVRNLVTHTSGLGYWFWNEELVRWESATGTPNVVAGSAASLTAPIGDLDFPAELPTADPAASHTFRAGSGFKWGYGLMLNTADIPGMRWARSGAWAGLCNTFFWIDRTAGICASIYSSFLPFVTPEAVALYNGFERALYAAL